MNQKFGGNYLGETTLIAAARAHGFNTAIMGKEGPVAHPGFHGIRRWRTDPDRGRHHRP